MILQIFQDKKTAQIVFLVSLLVSMYWIGVQNIDVYQWAFIGAIFEMMSLLFIGALFSIPLLILVLSIINKLNISVWYYISFVITITTLILLFTVYN